MKTIVKFLLFLNIFAFLISFAGCKSNDEPKRETIFDRKISISKEIILDIPIISPLCDEIKGFKKGFVDIKDGKLYFEEIGSGVPIILINGGPGGTHHEFHPYFTQMQNQARVIYYDQRGTGLSSKDPTGKTYTIKQAVEDLENLRKSLNIDKWVVLGYSYGGYLARCYALTYPENLIGVVTVSANPGPSKSKLKPTRWYMFISESEKKVLDNLVAKYEADEINMMQLLYSKKLNGDWKRQNYYKPTKEQIIRGIIYKVNPGLEKFNTLMSNDMNKISLEGKFDDFNIPMLITEATWDLTWDLDKIEFMRKNHPNAQIEIFKHSGHVIFADEEEKFFKILRKFIKEAFEKNVKVKAGKRLNWPKPQVENRYE